MRGQISSFCEYRITNKLWPASIIVVAELCTRMYDRRLHVYWSSQSARRNRSQRYLKPIRTGFGEWVMNCHNIPRRKSAQQCVEKRT